MWDIDTGNVDGKVYGKAGDKNAFYGTPPSPQRSNPIQAMIGALPLGTLLTAACNDASALALITTLTTAVDTVTFAPLLSTDFVMAVSKPTANAGFGIAGVFANSANTLGILGVNPTAANVTPSTNETLALAIFRGMNTVTSNLTPALVPANTTVEQIFTVAAANATGTPVVNAAGQLVGANITAGGTNYVVPPTVVFSTSNTTGPLLPYPTIETGTITGVGKSSQYGQYPYPGGFAESVAAIPANCVLPTATADVYSGAVIGIRVTNPGQNLPATGLTMSFVGGNTISPGMICQVNVPAATGFTAGSGIGNVRVVGNNQVAIEFFNVTAANVTPAPGNYTFLALNSLPAVTNVVTVTSNLAAPSNTGANTVGAIPAAVVGLTANDVMLSASPPSLPSANTVLTPGICAANAANMIEFGAVAGNLGAGAYTMAILRPSAQPPMIVYSLFLTPSAIANNTTAEQIFTLPAALLVSGNPVLVNKQSLTNGVSIVNARANSANALGITYMNQTGANVTPAAEPYLVASFPGLIPTLGASGANSITYGYSTQQCGISWNQLMNLQNEMQQTLTQKGLIAGS